MTPTGSTESAIDANRLKGATIARASLRFSDKRVEAEFRRAHNAENFNLLRVWSFGAILLFAILGVLEWIFLPGRAGGALLARAGCEAVFCTGYFLSFRVDLDRYFTKSMTLSIACAFLATAYGYIHTPGDLRQLYFCQFAAAVLFLYLHMGLDFRVAAPLGWIACLSFLAIILTLEFEGWLRRDLYSIIEILVANALVMFNARDHELSNRRFFRANKVMIRQRELEAELQQRLNLASRQEAVGRLAGGVAHDFNNLLQVISGAAQYAIETGPSVGPVADQLRLVYKTAQSGGALTRQLLAFSREGTVSRAPLDLHALIERNAEIFRRVFGPSISIETNLQAAQAWVSADLGMLEQVLLNLALNARDAMPNGGKLTLSTAVETPTPEFLRAHPWAKAEQYLVMSMADSGVGMTEEVMQRIFEPFFTTKELGRGTGLGLSSAYGILQQHEGMIEVQSYPGLGTTFRVYLPALPMAAVPQISSEPVAAPPGTETLLVVEDNPDLCWVLCEMLQGHGYRVVSALDGERGLEVFRENQKTIRLAILDVMLPRMDGYELFGRIRELNPNLPAIFTSGYTGGAIDRPPPGGEKAPLLRKPYKNETLYRLIREQLDAAKG